MNNYEWLKMQNSRKKKQGKASKLWRRKPSYFLFSLLCWWISCSPLEEEISFNPNLEILFSNDTVFFDTLLTQIRTHTRKLTVYNPNERAILLSEIRLGKRETSDYSVIINGKPKDWVVNERILGGDSLRVLVEANITPRNRDNPYLVKDSLIFSWNGNVEHVKFISWGQDARKIQNKAVCDETWTSSRPYILKDTVVVSPGCRLDIERGTTIFFENDAALFIQGTLTAKGDSANHILFRNARLDGIYNEVPGQWNGIYFLEGSQHNEIIFAEIFNGQIGLRIGTPDEDDELDVKVSHTRIYNMSNAGILSFNSDVEVVNSLIYNCGVYLAGHFIGGNYSYLHCTLSHFPSSFILEGPGIQFTDNIILDNDEVLSDDLSIEMVNCILWGSANQELLINNGAGRSIETTLLSNIIRSDMDIEHNYASLESNFPGFKKPFSFDFSLKSLAFARDKGIPTDILHDIDGKSRDIVPDIGAFERVDEE